MGKLGDKIRKTASEERRRIAYGKERAERELRREVQEVISKIPDVVRCAVVDEKKWAVVMQLKSEHKLQAVDIVPEHLQGAAKIVFETCLAEELQPSIKTARALGFSSSTDQHFIVITVPE